MTDIANVTTYIDVTSMSHISGGLSVQVGDSEKPVNILEQLDGGEITGART